jgi:hypothetical protein
MKTLLVVIALVALCAAGAYAQVAGPVTATETVSVGVSSINYIAATGAAAITLNAEDTAKDGAYAVPQTDALIGDIKVDHNSAGLSVLTAYIAPSGTTGGNGTNDITLGLTLSADTQTSLSSGPTFTERNIISNGTLTPSSLPLTVASGIEPGANVFSASYAVSAATLAKTVANTYNYTVTLTNTLGS